MPAKKKTKIKKGGTLTQTVTETKATETATPVSIEKFFQENTASFNNRYAYEYLIENKNRFYQNLEIWSVPILYRNVVPNILQDAFNGGGFGKWCLKFFRCIAPKKKNQQLKQRILPEPQPAKPQQSEIVEISKSSESLNVSNESYEEYHGYNQLKNLLDDMENVTSNEVHLDTKDDSIIAEFNAFLQSKLSGVTIDYLHNFLLALGNFVYTNHVNADGAKFGLNIKVQANEQTYIIDTKGNVYMEEEHGLKRILFPVCAVANVVQNVKIESVESVQRSVDSTRVVVDGPVYFQTAVNKFINLNIYNGNGLMFSNAVFPHRGKVIVKEKNEQVTANYQVTKGHGDMQELLNSKSMDFGIIYRLMVHETKQKNT